MKVDKFKKAYYLDKMKFIISVITLIAVAMAVIAVVIMSVLIWLKYKDCPVGDLPAWALPFFS